MNYRLVTIAFTIVAAATWLLNAGAQAPQGAPPPGPPREGGRGPQGGGPPQMTPMREIANLTGDLYRAQDNAAYRTVFLVTSQGIIVADPINTAFATWLKAELATRFPNRPVRYVLYSHKDFDHASGGGVFNDTAELVAHADFNPEVRKLQTDGGETFEDADRDKNGRLEGNELTARGGFLRGQDRNGDGVVTPMEVFGDIALAESTYTDRRTISLGGKSVELVHPGTVHSKDMTVVRFVSERVLYGVDIIRLREFPMFLDGPPDELVTTLRNIEKLDFETVAPAHGSLGTKADLVRYREFVQELIDGVRAGIRANQSVEMLQASLTMNKYRDWPNYATQKNQNIADMHRLLTARPR